MSRRTFVRFPAAEQSSALPQPGKRFPAGLDRAWPAQRFPTTTNTTPVTLDNMNWGSDNMVWGSDNMAWST